MLSFLNENNPIDPDLIFDGYMSHKLEKFNYKNCIELGMKGVFIYSISVNTENLPPDYSNSMVLLTKVLVYVTEIRNEQKKILESILSYPTLSQSIRMGI